MVFDFCKSCGCRADKCLSPDSHRAQSKHVWCCDFLLGGSRGKRIRKQFKPGITKKEVEKYEHISIADFERGMLLPTDKSKTSFGDVFFKYMDEHLAVNTRSYERMKYYEKAIKEMFGHYPIGMLTLEHLADRRAEFQQARELSNSSVNRVFTLVTACLNKAVEWGYLQKSPAQFLRHLSVKEGKPRFLTIEEIAKLRVQVRDWRLSDYISVLLHTGIRPGNIKELTWSDVDRQNRIIHVTTYKGRQPHTYSVPIDAELNYIIERRFKETNGLGRVFDTSCVKDLAQAAIKESGINDGRPDDERFTIYGLKHCYASHLLMNGATLFDVAKLLGHTDTRMVFKFYGHLTQEHLRAVQSKINLTPKMVPELKVV